MDGGVGATNAAACAAAGANMLVAGTAVFGAGEGAGAAPWSHDAFARLSDAVAHLQALGADAQRAQAREAETIVKGQ